MLPNEPLAERRRPKTLDQYAGQIHLLGKDAALGKLIRNKQALPSIIFWGPPGVGKTTLARLIAKTYETPFYSLSAIASGVKEVREVIDAASRDGNLLGKPILFIDEIHRFSKSQQDSLLGAVERGLVTLIGATTENPSFEVIPALLSRCQVYTLKSLLAEELKSIAMHALEEDPYLKPRAIEIDEWESLLLFSGGDARKLLNTLDLIVSTQKEGETLHITNELCKEIIQENPGKYDKTGEQHYDIISAFIKSIRGSDPNATMYYLARMVEGGEDPKFIARRMLILASEDIGLANPTAMILANSCFQAVTFIGYPECDLILSETALYLCSSPKSNSAYVAIRSARKLARESDFQVPLHLRNAPTALLEELGYGAEYQYAHNFPGNFISQEFLPAGLEGTTFFQPSDNARERDIREFLRSRWKEKYGY